MTVTIIDYGLSNLLSVQRAVQTLGHTPELTSDPSVAAAARVLLLPGVGAFRDGMRGLEKLDLVEAIRDCAGRDVPIMGICLGMQMLFDQSEEFGIHRGLGLIPGWVTRIPETDTAGARQNVPHVGWNGLLPPIGRDVFGSPLLADTAPGDETYFVHSYEAKPRDPAHTLAECDYGGRRVCAVAARGSVFGAQFHPERSGGVGLALLARFVGMAE